MEKKRKQEQSSDIPEQAWQVVLMLKHWVMCLIGVLADILS